MSPNDPPSPLHPHTPPSAELFHRCSTEHRLSVLLVSYKTAFSNELFGPA
ncbi:MAG: hypothetical protein AB2693_12595 [Candidatus Thiodiazotropha sp.]